MHIEQNVPMSGKTTFHIGGPADYFVSVSSRDDIAQVIAFAREKHLSIYPFGGGSNVLVSDDGIRGMVMHLAMTDCTFEERENFAVLAHVGAGVVWDDFVADAVHKGYWGVENLSAIPGSVGATPVQNVGAYGVEVGQLIESVLAVDLRDGTQRSFTNDECAFGYRSSFFKSDEGRHYAIVRVTFRLTRVPTPRIHYKDLVRTFGDRVPELHEIRDAVIAIRARKFPDYRVIGTAGSFFKNPRVTAETFKALIAEHPDLPGFPESDGRVKVQLGWILDKVLHLRGVRDGAVGTYEGQSLVLVNHGDARAEDVDRFATMIESKVRKVMGIEIAREVGMMQ